LWRALRPRRRADDALQSSDVLIRVSTDSISEETMKDEVHIQVHIQANANIPVRTPPTKTHIPVKTHIKAGPEIKNGGDGG